MKMFNNQFTSQARTAISLARKAAADRNQSYIGTEHLLLGLLREGKGTAATVLTDFGVRLDKLESLVDEQMAHFTEAEVIYKPDFTPNVEAALGDAIQIAHRHGESLAGTEHVLMAVLRRRDSVAVRLLRGHPLDVSIEKLYLAVLKATGEDEKAQKQDLIELRDIDVPKAYETPTLDQYSRDLTAMARDGKLDPVVGRDQEITRVIEILSRRKKNNPCLIGEPGVGKTAIVEGLAERIVSGCVPQSMKNRRVIVLDLSGMVAGSKYRGEFEERIKKVIKEVMDDQTILLFIDEIHTIIGAGGAEGALDASNILKPSLARGEIQLIGATTIEEYRKHIEKDAALERRFQPVTVEEPGEEETLEILKGLRPYYEEHHGVKITDQALDAAVRMSTRYISDRFQPDKAIDVIDEACSSVQLGAYTRQTTGGKNKAADKTALRNQIQTLLEEKENAIRKGDFEEAAELQKKQESLQKKLAGQEKKDGGRTGGRALSVTAEDIARTVSIWTKIPVSRIAEAESKRLAKLESILHKRVVGQEEAVTAVSKAIRRGRVGLKDPSRPIGSFLFLGPTGVGKTELSKALAEAVFGSEEAMIRVDMSEYMEKASVAKLIGSPPGYVGYDEGGQLSEKIRRHPYSVVLFDEIEKAHPDVFNILLQVLDDGHITDSQGRKVSFKETIIIMTSNAGANRIVEPKKLGFMSVDDEKVNYENMKSQVMEEVKRMFRPEFLNRIDDILVFHSLTKTDMDRIIDILTKDLIKRCQDNMEIKLTIAPSARKLLIDSSFDHKYGARPLKRAIQSKVEDSLAEEILSGKIKRGDKISVGVKDGKIVFAKK